MEGNLLLLNLISYSVSTNGHAYTPNMQILHSLTILGIELFPWISPASVKEYTWRTM